MLTKAQQEAICSKGHVWVHASAGTGKTFVLIHRIIRLLVEGACPHQIVALTFTQNAAQEMLDRVYQILEQISLCRTTCVQELTLCLGTPPCDALIRRGQSLWSEVIENPLNIQTIHGFCQNILKRFPLESGVSSQFTVIDASRAGHLWQQAQDQVCSILYTCSPPLKDALSRLGKRYSIHSLTAHLKQLWQRPEMVRFPTDHPSPSEPMGPPPLSPQILAQLQQWIALEHVTGDIRGLYQSWESPEYRAFFLTQQGSPRKVLISGKLPPPLKLTLIEAQAALCQAIKHERAHQAWQDTQDFCCVFLEMYRQYSAYKEASGWLDFNDLIQHTLALLYSPEHMGWVYGELDRAIHHLLLDEAQDTSPAQWKILMLLSDIWQGQSHKTFFVVGDPKQSIYSFQGADLTIFFAAQTFFKETAHHGSIPFKTIELTHSFRSYSHILDGVNTVFKAHTTMEFTPHSALPQHTGGHLELWTLGCEPTSLSRAETLAELWAHQITHWIENPFFLHCTGQAVRSEDIMILLSKRCSLYTCMIDALHRKKLQISQSRALYLHETLFVQDILALIQVMLSPQDNWHLVQILKSPMFGLSNEFIHELTFMRETHSVWEQLKKMTTLPWIDCAKHLDYVYTHFKTMTPFAFFQWWVHTPWMSERYTCWPYAAEIIDQLCAHLFSACEHQGLGWSEWIHLFSAQPISLQRQAERTEGIKVLTVHGAKGLQSPIVIIPDLIMESKTKDLFCYTPQGPWKMGILDDEEHTFQQLHAQQQKEESDRLLYVAMTRAQERLYCSSLKENMTYQHCHDAILPLAHPFSGSIEDVKIQGIRYC